MLWTVSEGGELQNVGQLTVQKQKANPIVNHPSSLKPIFPLCFKE